MASSVLPNAMPIDVRIDPVVLTLTRNAARKVGHQAGRPIRRTAAMAMPVGGQTGVTLGLTDARDNPNLAVATYATNRAASTASRRIASDILPRSPRGGKTRMPSLTRLFVLQKPSLSVSVQTRARTIGGSS